MKLCDQGIENLTHAIYMRACADYKKAYKDSDTHEMNQIKRFFKSKWCELLCGLGVVDSASQIIKALENQVDYAEWRKSKKCLRCKRKNCIHFSGEHWTTIERCELECQKELETIEH